MPIPCPRRACFAMVALAVTVVEPAVGQPVLEFQGMANASAAVRIGEDRFLAGTDEYNVLQLYRVSGGAPLASFPSSPWLGLTTRNGEADFEGAARIGEVTFWIGSHGRNDSGDKRPDRQRLLGLRVRDEEGQVKLEPIGPPMTTLIDQLAATPSLARFDFASAARIATDKPGSLNIEGLAAAPEGSLLLGFRSPLSDQRALLIPLTNPLEAIQGRPAMFGEAQLLDLGGLGIRDLLWTGRDFLLIAGSYRGGGKSRLYRWAGGTNSPQHLAAHLPKSFNPEAILLFEPEGKRRLLVLSDDGGRKGNDQTDPTARNFRAAWVNLPESVVP